MKKTYVKPEIMLVRFELSEAIASCGTLLYSGHDQSTCSMNSLFSDMGINVTDDNTSCTVPLYGYCYFTSNGTGTMLMNS